MKPNELERKLEKHSTWEYVKNNIQPINGFEYNYYQELLFKYVDKENWINVIKNRQSGLSTFVVDYALCILKTSDLRAQIITFGRHSKNQIQNKINKKSGQLDINTSSNFLDITHDLNDFDDYNYDIIIVNDVNTHKTWDLMRYIMRLKYLDTEYRKNKNNYRIPKIINISDYDITNPDSNVWTQYNENIRIKESYEWNTYDPFNPLLMELDDIK